MLYVLILLIGMPILEVWLLIEVGGTLGGWTTVGLCLLTGVVGAALARSQGSRVLSNMRGTLEQGGLPARELLDGAMILVAGAVLLTPGFVTDAIGLLLLTPPIRALLRPAIGRWLERRLRAQQAAAEARQRFIFQMGGDPFDPFSGGDPFSRRTRADSEPSDDEEVGVEIIYPPRIAPRTPPRREAPKIITYDD